MTNAKVTNAKVTNANLELTPGRNVTLTPAPADIAQPPPQLGNSLSPVLSTPPPPMSSVSTPPNDWDGKLYLCHSRPQQAQRARFSSCFKSPNQSITPSPSLFSLNSPPHSPPQSTPNEPKIHSQMR